MTIKHNAPRPASRTNSPGPLANVGGYTPSISNSVGRNLEDGVCHGRTTRTLPADNGRGWLAAWLAGLGAYRGAIKWSVFAIAIPRGSDGAGLWQSEWLHRPGN